MTHDTAVCGRVSGRVQGVAYRMSLRHRALALELDGWVRNLSDGSVEFVAGGTRAAVESLLDWARTGPPLARVDDLRVEPAASPITPGFEIRVDGAAE